MDRYALHLDADIVERPYDARHETSCAAHRCAQASAFADMPDAELETALRAVVHDVLGGRQG